MAIEQVQNLPQQYVTDLGADYGKQLAGLTSIPLDTARLAPQVAAQDPLQTQAYNLAGQGVGAYQPYLTQQAAYSGPQAYQAFQSPYQQDVIDATLSEFDKQTQAGLTGIGQNAAMSGNLGGGREGVMRSEYQTQSDLNRAMLQAQMLQQGYGQAQQARQQDFRQQQALATQQAGLGTQALGNVQRQIAGLGTLGATQQAQTQAGLDAQRQFAQMAVQEPTTRLGMLGQGVTGLMGGTQGMGTTLGQAPPQTSPLGTALGIGSTLAGIYGYMNK